MIRQIVNGRTVGVINPTMSTADFTILSAVLAGKSEHWNETASGGTPLTVTVPNAKKFSLGKVDIDGRISSAVSLPHAKIGASDDDIRGEVIGLFDVTQKSSVKADYCNMIGNSSRG